MATAFSLTLAYLGERYSAENAVGAFAAYITGNVASNLVGRLIAAEVTEHRRPLGELLHLCRAQSARRRARLLHHSAHRRRADAADDGQRRRHGELARALPAAPAAARRLRHRLLHPVRLHRHLHLRQLRPVAAAAVVGMMELGFIYLVFLPSIITTPLAGHAAKQARHAATRCWRRLATAGRACRSCCSSRLSLVLAGMVLVAVGTFFAQAAGDRLRQPHGDDRSQRGERHVSRQLLHRRIDRHRRARRRSSIGSAGRRRSIGIAIALGSGAFLSVYLRSEEAAA